MFERSVRRSDRCRCQNSSNRQSRSDAVQSAADQPNRQPLWGGVLSAASSCLGSRLSSNARRLSSRERLRVLRCDIGESGFETAENARDNHETRFITRPHKTKSRKDLQSRCNANAVCKPPKRCLSRKFVFIFDTSKTRPIDGSGLQPCCVIEKNPVNCDDNFIGVQYLFQRSGPECFAEQLLQTIFRLRQSITIHSVKRSPCFVIAC